METLNINSATRNVTLRFRTIALFAGIVIAIICGLIAFTKIQSSDDDAVVLESFETQVYTKANQIRHTAAIVSRSVLTFSKQ